MGTEGALGALGALHKQLQFLQGSAASSGMQAGGNGAVFVPRLAGAALSEAETLITPVNADQPTTAFLAAAATAPLGAAPALAPPSCCLCGGVSNEAACGVLRPVTLDDQPAAVHHLCALWAPNCYMSQVGAAPCHVDCACWQTGPRHGGAHYLEAALKCHLEPI